MAQAEVYYYPTGLGHTGINLTFSKDEIPEREKYPILIYSKGNGFEEDCKLAARRRYGPAIFLQDNGQYSIYGYKDGFWQETPLNDLSSAELLRLQSLSFDPVATQENGQSFYGSYQNGVWEKKAMPEHSTSGHYTQKSITPSDPLFNLLQKGHPEFKRTQYFFDWGGLYDFEENAKGRGEPIRIPLPPTNKSFNDFFTEVEKGDYNYGEPRDSTTYDLFRNNCAHATMELLYEAGYMPKKPSKSFALIPLTVAKKACSLAHQSREIFRKQLLESVEKTDTKALIDTLLELSKNRLNENLHFNYGKYIGGSAKELGILSEIKYDGSDQSIERLLKASEDTTANTARELEDCIALVDPEKCFNAGMARLESVAKGLKNKNQADSLQGIVNQMRCEFKHFKKNAISQEQFSKNCATLIEKATPILKSQGSACLQVLKNIALAVCGLVALYLVAGFINKSNTGNFMFFKEPSLSKIGTDIQHSVNRLKP